MHEAKEETSVICNMVAEQMHLWNLARTNTFRDGRQPFKNDAVLRILEAATDIEDRNLLLRVYKLCSENIPVKNFFHVGYAIGRINMSELMHR